MWGVYDFLSHCFLPQHLSFEEGALGSGSPHNALPHLLYTLFFWRLTGRESGIIDRVDRLWVAPEKKKKQEENHWFPFCWISNDLPNVLFYLLSLANGILSFVFDKRFYSIGFSPFEPRLTFKCFVVAGMHLALAFATKTSHSTLFFAECEQQQKGGACLSIPYVLSVSQQRFVRSRIRFLCCLITEVNVC